MNWIIIFFITIGITGLLMLFNGVKNRSLGLLLFGGGALVAPFLFFGNLSFLLPMIPPTVMGILYLTQKTQDKA
ncbi:hypothetical protein QOZ98_000143 [Planomicrobium stackebrandtii]|uniref:Uncharacterized protein n=1 Tax=Planomicrobium stackebrandtii TaxID=253160 RepID=A0ABU0GPU4_9BACL|nr:hypothetical protein [Planomicrobium stackebrandtii]MDQ0427318.1 hypothetical protein [Planomicrobium stackebrandtii]